MVCCCRLECIVFALRVPLIVQRKEQKGLVTLSLSPMPSMINSYFHLSLSDQGCRCLSVYSENIGIFKNKEINQ